MSSYNPRVDAFIDSSAKFATEILIHLREIVHVACPEVVEDIKWNMPAFMYKGSIMCGMAAFKKHCAFSFWHGAIMDDPHGVLKDRIGKSSIGSFGKITSMKDLPHDDIIVEYIAQAAILIEKGIKPTVAKIAEREPLIIPDDFLNELKNNGKALAFFESLSYSKQKEFLQWIIEAKRKETRTNRIYRAVEMLMEGKSFNWKYEQKVKFKGNNLKINS